MDRTKHRNAVLIFIAADQKSFAILGDIGIHQKVGDDFWSTTRDQMLSHFKSQKFFDGILCGVKSAGAKLKEFFPSHPDDTNELSNQVTEK